MKPIGLFVFGVLSVGIAIAADYSRSAAVAPAPALSCRAPARAMTRLEMLFGTARPNGPPISDEEWAAFVDAEVTPRFSDGLTVLAVPANGATVTVLYPGSSPTSWSSGTRRPADMKPTSKPYARPIHRGSTRRA